MAGSQDVALAGINSSVCYFDAYKSSFDKIGGLFVGRCFVYCVCVSESW